MYITTQRLFFRKKWFVFSLFLCSFTIKRVKALSNNITIHLISAQTNLQLSL